jgi:hypothetical protein
MENNVAVIQKTSTNLINKKTAASNQNGCRIGVVDNQNSVVAFEKDLYLIQLQNNDTNSKVISPAVNEVLDSFHRHDHNIEDVKTLQFNDALYIYTVSSNGSFKISSRTLQNEIIKSVSFDKKCSLNSWAGVAINSTDPLNCSVAHFFEKTIQCFKDGNEVGILRTVGHPTQINYLEDNNLIVVAEETHISLWDVREKGATRRLYLASPEMLNCLTTKINSIAVAGESKNVTFFDTRTWMTNNTWKNCTKYAIRNLLFSKSNTNMCFVGDDTVLLCNPLDNQKKINYFESGIRFESRSLGISQSSTQDVVMGFTENGRIFNIQNWTQNLKSNSPSQDEDDISTKKRRKDKLAPSTH